ncbi:putative cytochrome b5 [Fusarium oxysporum f. sp. cubense]|uniref:Putative cytochrome b5 n=1 Tax=Fusarium oxysporum f. sp. cubense TaxID=61366 RepID=A0A559LLP2_FUSOC|nr:putative cytochrome b5 [Fusarium oxysporum f. sp. cubense]
MAKDNVFSYQDVARHNTKNDLYVVIHDKVYDCTEYLGQHPYVSPTLTLLPLVVWRLTVPSDRGGEELILDVAGEDSTEAFEQTGHSDEAREVVKKLYVGDLKREARILVSTA